MFLHIITIALVFFLLTTLIYRLLKKFNKVNLFIYFLIPLLIFTTGFILRLSSKNEFIGLGYFLTDISNLWLYILFTLGIILGQVKYWKK